MLTRKHSKNHGSDSFEEEKNMAGFEGLATVVYEGKTLSAGILEGKTYVELRTLANYCWG
jgi:hypothetical protein